MVRHVDQRRVHTRLMRLQLLLQPREQMVGVQQRVVVGVDDLLARAALQIVVLAGRCETRKGRRVAPEVRGAMVAQLVQHQQLAAAGLGQPLIEPMGQAFVEATTVAAESGRIQTLHGVVGQAVAHALAAGLVVAPVHRHPGARQHVQQPLAVPDAAFVVTVATERREHAGHRDLGVRSAARHVAEVDDRQRGELRRGLPCIAVQAPVGRACGFADHEHDHQRTLAVRGQRAGPGVEPDRLARHGRALGVGHRHRAGRPHQVGRRDQVAHLAVVAHQRGQWLEDRDQRGHGHRQRQRDAAGTHPGCTRPPAVHDPHAPQQPDRQSGIQQQLQPQGRRQQLAGFDHVGAQHVAQHRRIEINAVTGHVVRRDGRHHGQQREQRLDDPAVGHQRQQQEVHRAEQHQQGQRETPGARIRRRAAAQCGCQEWTVGRQRPEHAGGQQQLFHRGWDRESRGAHLGHGARGVGPEFHRAIEAGRTEVRLK